MKKRTGVTIALSRDPDSNEVYLVERSPELKFFGGFYAFPGGTLDESDSRIEVRNSSLVDAGSRPFIVAAVREFFEETGILLTHGNAIPKERLAQYRQQLLAEEISLQSILEKEHQVVDAEDFNFIASILTPEFSPVRYDTQFYWTRLPEGVEPEIWPGELVGGDFFRAEEALEKWRTGEMLIVPPVLYMLRKITDSSLKAATPQIFAQAESYRHGEIHQVYFTPGVQLIALKTRTLLPATHTNTYLVGEQQQYIIDPAPSDLSEQKRLWNYLDDRLAEGVEFAGILLTHHHSDHIGALEECRRRYDLPVFAHEKTAEKLGNFKFERYLANGDELDLGIAPDGQGMWKLKVYHTPGHASGHLVFQETRYGAVIIGDMISTLSTIVISPPDGHLGTYMQSLEFLQSVIDGAIYPGHGPPVLTGKKLLQDFVKHRIEREEKLFRSLTTQPQKITELVAQVYDDVEPTIWPLAEHSLQAGLIKLIEENKCLETDEGYCRV